MQAVFKILAGVAAALFAAEAVSKVTTGKWAHEHLYDWWRDIRAKIESWCATHKSLKITRVVLVLVAVLDGAARNTIGRARIRTTGKSAYGDSYHITEDIVPLDQLKRQVPTAQIGQEVTVLTL